MKTVIEVKDLVKRYKELIALDHFNLSIKEGEIFGLLGPNGSGKTTTIHCILGLLSYDKGEIQVFGEKMKSDSYDLKRNIGVVMQNVAVFDELTVYENIDYFCGLYVKDKEKRKEYVQEALEFTGLEEYVKFYPKKLSGGLLRRLNIACGIAHKPKLIFFDEPTVAVDPQSRNKILEGIRKLNEEGATIVYTSHYMEEVESLCERITIMDHGKCVASGTTNELKAMIQKKETIQVEIPQFQKEHLEKFEKLPYVYQISYEEPMLQVHFNGGNANLIHVLEELQKNEISYGRIYSELPTLNDVFLEITGKELRN